MNVELIPNGKEKDVTEKNKDEYIALMVQWRTDFAIRAQLDAFLDGFHSLVPLGALAQSAMAVSELDLLINGAVSVNVDDVRPYARYQVRH